MKKHKGKIIAGILILFVLTVTYFWGGNYVKVDKPHNKDSQINADISGEPSLIDKDESKEQSDDVESLNTDDDLDGLNEDGENTESGAQTDLDKLGEKPKKSESSEVVEEGSESYSKEKGMIIDTKTGKDKYLTDPVPEGKPIPVEPQDTVVKDASYTCTLSVRCDTILDNMDYLDEAKWELVPEDGVIFPATKVTFYEGESVFNLLQREMKKNKIHMEFRNTPMYNSAYICGINNLYEFDVGELSGWMHKVNDWFPNYGVSRYKLEEGDVVEFVYTCDLGRDVGGHSSLGGE